MNIQPDILILGGGLIGSVLYLALQDTNYDVMWCDAGDLSHKTESSFDARSIALNQASVHILQALGIWKDIQLHATPIQTIQVSSQGQFGLAELTSQDHTPLGQVVEIHRFYQALLKQLRVKSALFNSRLTHYHPETQTVTIQTPKKIQVVKPKFIIAAEGTRSSLQSFVKLPMKRQTVTQCGLLANVALRRPHHGYAYERFTQEGPLALLPLEDQRMAMVWCLPAAEGKRLQQLPKSSFLRALYESFGYRLGHFAQVGERVCFPLEQTWLPITHQWPVVFIGNAAQTLHPIGGQGFNLGLRDIAHLLQSIAQWGLTPEMLTAYFTLREPDRDMIGAGTQAILSVFQQSNLLVRCLRSLGLVTFEQTHCLEPLLVRYASGLGGVPPDLACGFSLRSMRRQHEF